jgi:metal-responsive CopG/Arc/MetJ family transcriptional regulator
MRKVRMTRDDVLKAVDEMASKLGTTRSALTRDALRAALARQRELALEQSHIEGYKEKPVKRDEFSIPEAEHAWGDK